LEKTEDYPNHSAHWRRRSRRGRLMKLVERGILEVGVREAELEKICKSKRLMIVIVHHREGRDWNRQETGNDVGQPEHSIYVETS